MYISNIIRLQQTFPPQNLFKLDQMRAGEGGECLDMEVLVEFQVWQLTWSLQKKLMLHYWLLSPAYKDYFSSFITDPVPRASKYQVQSRYSEEGNINQMHGQQGNTTSQYSKLFTI